MVELRLESIANSNMPADTFVSVRIGETQKLSRLASSRVYRFPQVGDRRYGKIEVYQRIGSCNIDINPQNENPREVSISCADQGFGVLGLKVDVEADAATKEKEAEGPQGKKVGTKVKAAKDYLNKHGLEVRLSEAMQAVLRERPEDPVGFLAAKLNEGNGGNGVKLPPLAASQKEGAPMPASRVPADLGDSQAPPSHPPPVAKPQKLEPLNQDVQKSAPPPAPAKAPEPKPAALLPFTPYYREHFSAMPPAQFAQLHGRFPPAARPVKVSSKKTTTGEPILDGLPLCVPKVLMPRSDINLEKWATVACDQFESEPAYWKEMAEFASGQPSALNIVFPEVYLASVTGADPSEDSRRIAQIGRTMRQYVADGVFRDTEPAFIALDRKTQCVPTRKGLVCAVDLDQYNFNCPKPTLIRPTEKTIVARLPPRIAIRQDAPLELPHIIMIIADPGKTVIEPLFSDGRLTKPEYECNLFKGAGSVKGLRVTDAGTQHVTKTLKALADRETAAAKAAGREPAVILIGDGNHSLATAKSCWENLKAKGGVDKECHPARFALVELQNLHDDGVVFEPIHRILEGARADDLQSALEAAWGVKAAPFAGAMPLHSVVLVRKEGKFTLIPPKEALPVVSMTAVVDDFVAKHPAVKIGYVHGEEPVADAVRSGAVGLLLPKLDKSRFLETIHAIGTLPRKAFSMGEANEKRFYVEARSILQWDSPAEQATSKAGPAEMLPFKEYYAANFVGAPREPFTNLYSSFPRRAAQAAPAPAPAPAAADFRMLPSVGTWLAPKAVAVKEPPQPKEPFQHKPSVGTWLVHRRPEPAEPPAKAEPAKEERQDPFQHKPSVGTWLVHRRPMPAEAVKEDRQDLFQHKPSVGTWLVHRRPKPAEAVKEHRQEELFQHKPSVGTWLVHRRAEPAAAAKQDAAPAAAAPNWCLKPSIGTWLSPRPVQAQKDKDEAVSAPAAIHVSSSMMCGPAFASLNLPTYLPMFI